MFRTLKSNSPFSAPRDDTPRARAAETERKANSCYPRFQTRVCFRWCVNAFATSIWCEHIAILHGRLFSPSR